MADYSPFVLVSDAHIATPEGYVQIARCDAGFWYGPAGATQAELIAKIKSARDEDSLAVR